jgi:hypothetical protein
VPRNCNCAGASCGCKVEAGTAITVTGTGTAADPYVIVNAGASLGTALQVTDTLTFDMVKAGSGTNVDPIILSGNVTLKLQQLTDVNDPQGGPLNGEVAVYVGTSGSGGHWEFRAPFPPYTTAGRPAATTVPIGGTYFDTTLNKPGWSNGTNWRDATGTAM